MTEGVLNRVRTEQATSVVEINLLAKILDGYDICSNSQSEILKLATKNLYFLSFSIQYLVSELKKIKRNRDLDESQVVLLEIKIQLLAAQIERVLAVSDTEKEYQESVLGVLLNKLMIEVSGVFLKIQELLTAGDERAEANINIDELLNIYDVLNKGLSKLTKSCSEKIIARVYN